MAAACALAGCSSAEPGAGAGGGAEPAPAGASADPNEVADPSTPSSAAAPLPVRARGICPGGTYAAAPLAAGAAPTIVPIGGAAYAHLDGPAWRHSVGQLAFSAWSAGATAGQGPISTLLAVDSGGNTVALAAAGVYGSNGLAVDAGDQLVAALHDHQEVARLQPAAGTRQTLASGLGGRPFNAPNDLALRRDGNIYLTDPNYQADGRPGQDVTGVYRIAPDGAVTLVDGGRDQPNGIALALTDDTLWVGGNDQRILAYPLAADGTAGPPAAFVEAGDNVDGMTVDCAGNLYAILYNSQRLAVWSAIGAPLATVSLPETATNLAFGGADRQTLYITALTHLYALRAQVPGLPD